MKNVQLRKLIEIAIFAALALIFDLFIPSISDAVKISFKMLPIIVLALRWGLGAGLTGGLIWGLLQIAIGEAVIVGPVQVIIEYVFAFAAVGVAGIFSNTVQNQLNAKYPKLINVAMTASVAAALGSLARYIFHFIAGFIFWGQYAPEGQSPVIYSLSVNGLAFITEAVTCIVILWLMIPTYKLTLLNKNR